MSNSDSGYAPFTKNNSLPRKCTYCTKICIDGSSMCEEHFKKVKKYSPKEKRLSKSRTIRKRKNNPLYNTTAWRAFRRSVLRRRPLCVACEAKGAFIAAAVLDHIVPLVRLDSTARTWYAGNGRLDRSNVQGLCLHHHGIKNKWEKKNIAIDWINNRKIKLN